MSKLPEEHRFVDLSDYGRPAARLIANSLKDTSATAIHVTIAFIICGLMAAYCILNGYFILAALLLVLKSILDGADGELARITNNPSYVGRYLDSIADIILNLIFLVCIWWITESNIFLLILAFISIQLQGTLYNYYYVILRNYHDGDTTSRIFEDHAPTAMSGEKQAAVNGFYRVYNVLYIAFDKAIYNMDKSATIATNFPRWFMTAVSTFGLGFQLLMISIFLILDLPEFVLPYFVASSAMIIVYILIRKKLN